MGHMSKTNEMTEVKKTDTTKEYIAGMLAILFSIAFAWIIIPKIVGYINPEMIDLEEIKKIIYFYEAARPEPIERSIFLITIIMLPVLLLIFISLFNYILKKNTNSSLVKHAHNGLFAVSLGLIAYLAWIVNKKESFFYFINSIGFKQETVYQNGISIQIGTILFVAFISFIMNLLILRSRKNQILDKFSIIILFLADAVCWIAILSVVLICIFSIGLVSEMGTYSGHFNGFFHSVVQIYFGKESLYDLFSRYGLYAHFLEPIWRIIGLSVFKFTLIMGLLLGIILALLYKLLKELIDNKIIAYLSFLSIIWCVFMYGRIFWMYRWAPEFIDNYFQYFPLRMLFAAISIYFTYYYFKTSSRKLYYLSFAIYAISMFWNFDTGFVVYLTWLIMLIYEGLCDRSIKKILFHIVNWVSILLLIIGLFTSYMYLRYGHSPAYEQFLMFQRIFYIYGYAMLPMPLIHPWNIIVIIYLIGMAVSLINLLKGNRSLKVSMIFNLSILGVGLFSYYQGRSHDFCLVAVSYPAIILLTIFADELTKKIKVNKSILNFIALNFITFFMIYSSLSFAKNYKIIFTTIKERIEISIGRKNTPVIRSAEFIKNNTKKGEELLIISNLCSIYYLESKTTSPIKAEPLEFIFVSEVDEILDYLKSSLCKKVILDVNQKDKDIWNCIQTNFKLVLVSPDKNVGIFEK